MSHLGMLLGLEDGSRLTDVGLYPSAPTGTVYLNVLTPHSREDPSSLAGAVSAFLPARLLTLSGYGPDGSTWFATAQAAAGDAEQVNSGPAADAALRRALQLTGTRAGRFRGFALPRGRLVDAYGGEEDVRAWSSDELFLGLVVELTGVPIEGIVREATLGGQGPREYCGEMLERWSAGLS